MFFVDQLQYGTLTKLVGSEQRMHNNVKSEPI
jgi:hypothetical protein